MSSINPGQALLKATHPEESFVSSYRDFIRHAARTSLDFDNLNSFVNRCPTDPLTAPSRITLLEISAHDAVCQHKHEFSEIVGSQGLADFLSAKRQDARTCRLFLVENVDPDTIVLLGGVFHIDPQMFADHLENSSWYRISQIPQQLPALQSVKNEEDFIRLRGVAPRVLDGCDDSQSVRTFLYPDDRSTRVKRKGGKMKPFPRNGHVFEPIIITRDSIPVWFGASESGTGWNGMPFAAINTLPSSSLLCRRHIA